MILIVEDHPDSADVLLRLLKRFGYDVCCATTAAQALEALKRLPIRLAILQPAGPRRRVAPRADQRRRGPVGRARVLPQRHVRSRGGASRVDDGAAEWLVKGVHSVSRIVETVERLYRPTPT